MTVCERERERKHWNTGSTRGDRSPIENYEKNPLIPASIRGVSIPRCTRTTNDSVSEEFHLNRARLN